MRNKLLFATSSVVLGLTLSSCGAVSGSEVCSNTYASSPGTCYPDYNTNDFKHLVVWQKPTQAIYPIPKAIERRLGDPSSSEFMKKVREDLTPAGYELIKIVPEDPDDADKFVIAIFRPKAAKAT